MVYYGEMERIAYRQYLELDRRHFWKISRRRLVMDWLQRARAGKPSCSILDIGGANSLISGLMRCFGTVTVIEPDAETADTARRLFGLDVREGSLPRAIPVEAQFEVVTLLDVLEHIDDDQAALEKVYSLLKPGGVFLCTVPAGRILWSGHDLALRHKRRYSRPQLRRLIEKAGLRIERLSYYTFFYFPFTLLHRLLLKCRPPGRENGYVTAPRGRFLNNLLLPPMDLERFLLRYLDLPFGSSLIALCTKSPTHG